jgi:putative transposase
VVNAFTREALAIDVDQGIKGEQVVEAMTRIPSICGVPRTIRVDNGRRLSRRRSTAGHTRTA